MNKNSIEYRIARTQAVVAAVTRESKKLAELDARYGVESTGPRAVFLRAARRAMAAREQSVRDDMALEQSRVARSAAAASEAETVVVAKYQEVREIQEALEDARQEVESAEAAAQAVDGQEVVELEQKLARVQEGLEEVEAWVDEAQEKVDEAEAEIDEADADIEEARAALEEALDRKEDAEMALEEARASMEEAGEALNRSTLREKEIREALEAAREAMGAGDLEAAQTRVERLQKALDVAEQAASEAAGLACAKRLMADRFARYSSEAWEVYQAAAEAWASGYEAALELEEQLRHADGLEGEDLTAAVEYAWLAEQELREQMEQLWPAA